jgi:hypothetical protein
MKNRYCPGITGMMAGNGRAVVAASGVEIFWIVGEGQPGFSQKGMRKEFLLTGVFW